MTCGGESHEKVNEMRKIGYLAEEKVMRESTKYERCNDLQRRKVWQG